MDASSWLIGLTLRSTLVLVVALGLERLLRRKAAGARHLRLDAGRGGAAPDAGAFGAPAAVAAPARAALGRADGADGRPVGCPSGCGRAARASGERAAEGSRPRARRLPARAGRQGGRVGGRAFGGLGPVRRVAAGRGGGTAGTGACAAQRGAASGHDASASGPWLDTAEETCRAVGLSRTVPLLTSDAIETPLTSRWPSPAVLLPTAAEGWADERRRVVVQHELVHLARGDAWRLLAWRLVAVVYWFHPLARLAERHARLVGEQACDEAVLRLGTRPSAYARHLMEIAESLRVEPRRFAAALPMVDRGQLERRLLMILDAKRSVGRGRSRGGNRLFPPGRDRPRGLGSPLRCRSGRSAPKPVAAPITAAAPGGGADADPLRLRSRDERQLHGTFTSATATAARAALRCRSGSETAEALRAGHGPGELRREGRLDSRARSRQLRADRDGQGTALAADADHAGGRGAALRVVADGESRTPDDAARAWLADALQVVAAHREIGAIQGQVGVAPGRDRRDPGRDRRAAGRDRRGPGPHRGPAGQRSARSRASRAASRARSAATRERLAAWKRRARRRRAPARADRPRDRDAPGGDPQARGRAPGRRPLAPHGRTPRRSCDARRRRAATRSRRSSARSRRSTPTRKIQALEKQIEDIDADERIREIEKRMKPALDRLKDAVQRLSS